jgi:hypothetical protein
MAKNVFLVADKILSLIVVGLKKYNTVIKNSYPAF